MKRSCAILFATVIAIAAANASAQTYPARPITIVVPFAAGGPSDTIARIAAEHMRPSLGQPIIIENVAGAAGTIGAARVARANPDGYTLALGNWGSFVVTGAVYSLQYDLLKDFSPISMLPAEPFMVTSKANIPAKDLKEFIAWLKAKPDKVSAGTSGVGGPSHIASAFFQQLTGTRFQLVPYRGAGPAMQDVVAGQLDMMIVGPSLALPQARAGKVQVYAVAAKERSAMAPDIPSVDEAGLPGFYLSVWHGLWAPKGTPKEIVDKLAAAARTAMDHPGAREQFGKLGLEIPPPQTPEAFAAFHKAEVEKWLPIVKAAGIKAE